MPREGDQDAPLCDRDAALADNVELYGRHGGAIATGLLMLCGQTPEKLEDFADQTDGIGSTPATSGCPRTAARSSTCSATCTRSARRFRMTLNPDTADEKVLLDIPNWNFDWQMNYEPGRADPREGGRVAPHRVHLGPRPRPDAEPPKYIVFAEGTEDEMCFATYTLLPDPSTDTDDGS